MTATAPAAPAKVYFTNLRTHARESQLDKLKRLIRHAGIEQIDFENKFVAIKMHFGEPGNLAFLRPNYARVVADVVKDLGGKPFLTDCNTLYIGGRKNALDHLDSAYQNGFVPYATGCQVIIADGLKGTDEVDVPVEGGEYVKTAKIGRAVMDADIVISLTHFKCHEEAGVGGAMKNVGMGCGSGAGKREMHSDGRPLTDREKCVGCGACAKICAHKGPKLRDGKMEIDWSTCVGCGRCMAVCPVGAIYPAYQHSASLLGCKIAEYTKAVLAGRPSFHISLVQDVSPYCDCHAENDVPVVPDVGMFASFDPVALDLACIEAVNRQPILPGSALAERGDPHDHDHLHAAHPDTCWQAAIEHGKKIGLGTDEYTLITIK